MSTALATRGYLCHRTTFVLPGAPSISMGMELDPEIRAGSEEIDRAPTIQAGVAITPEIRGATADPVVTTSTAPTVSGGSAIVPVIRSAKET